jgi:AraC family transcriptional activator of pobA
MDLDEFIKDKAGCYSIESGFAVWEVKNNEFLRNVDIPEVHLQLLVIRGKINAAINDSHNITILADSLVDILHDKLFIKDASDDIHAVLIFTTETFVINMMNNKPPFPLDYVMRILEQPVFLLNHNQSLVIRERIELVLKLFRDTTHFHQSEMLKCALWMVYLEMANIFRHQNEDTDSSSETDRKRVLFMKFVRMLPSNIRKERSIAFYASSLCVSCQYLERVIKALSGETAYQWLQRTLIGEVNQELKETDKSIQQIASDFDFPDQASFTKYYKRNVKITPSEYRRKNMV